MRARRAASAAGGAWTKKLALHGRLVAARSSRRPARSGSGSSIAEPSEPSPPALDTAAASPGVLKPAIGAWTIGCAMPRRSVSARGQPAMR